MQLQKFLNIQHPGDRVSLSNIQHPGGRESLSSIQHPGGRVSLSNIQHPGGRESLSNLIARKIIKMREYKSEIIYKSYFTNENQSEK